MDAAIQEKVNTWLNGNYDQDTKNTLQELQKNNPDELTEAFYRNLEFGTGGLRGIMGVGTNRVNKYTIGMATQGFANYLKKTYGNKEIKMVIGHDSRNNSRFFAETTANVFAANGIKVFLFDSLRPTPEISFTIRYLKADGGVICTASHNPKEYNGYKAYWNDGGQLVPPHDKNVIKEVDAISSVDEVKWTGGESNITLVGKEIDEAYINMVKSLSVNPLVIKKQHDLKIVYTPIHGSGIMLVPQTLAAFGFDNVTIVKEQEQPDGNFPTVNYPNPEESEAMNLALKKAQEIDADILLGTDPDADRVGIGVKDNNGKWTLMNGNQTAVLACAYMIEARKAAALAKPNDMVIKTIVTTELIDQIATQNGVACYNVLTGFKWIAELIKEKEGKENYIIGGEESFGLMVGDQLRDKDAVSAVAFLCEMTAYLKWSDWSIPGVLYNLEIIRRDGYEVNESRNLKLWNFSNYYVEEKKDEDQKCGGAVLLRRMAEKQLIPVETSYQHRLSDIIKLGNEVPYSPGKKLSKTCELQKLLNLSGAYLREDGKAGSCTANAYHTITNYYLSGDPENQ